MEADVVVVGAGLAGLRCADRLAEGGRSVVVLERDATVGGRQHTDEVDGFLLDRGFHVLNPAYPAVRRFVDVDDLGLRPFGAGVLVRREAGLVEVAHPLREPRGVPATLRSGLLSPPEIATLARWAGPALTRPRSVVHGRDRSLREGLDAAGVSGPLRQELLEPLLAGVVAEDRGETSEAFVRLLVRMFALGVPGLPARGIQALPEWIADRCRRRRHGPELRPSTPVVGVRPGREPQVVCADGTTVTSRAAVVAVGPDAVSGLVDVPAPPTRGLRTWWFSVPEPPTDSAMVVVDGRRRGPMVNAAVMSNAVPSLAPPGAHLVQVTTLLGNGVDPTEQEVRRQAADVFGAPTGRWETIRRDDVHHALPAQLPPLRVTSPARVDTGVYVAGDHRDTASIQGALVSGDRVARVVLTDLADA
ncbi:FAD-dependent oxidoreductase [Phycicoccus sp. CSK15P-2]|uniref:NAD(P)/FAD-dependent oxidoreductase n=1 Tax=Phycicoccus sp. CSK15P-2 TaxID=2807627 RepID=UPI00194EE38C|nr:NAD(P)/FAD-dependent oxidoreductase [Phycicoccus sp. CSK15P-2]MBM6405309.1 FAD-dependent oxidoreductase [Phycicoccus sp. CSK15P-2]